MILPPIIITGMHRSGTTLLTSLLQQAGLFCGNDLEHNLESQFFIKLNEWILSQAGARWDQPEKMAALFNEEALLEPLCRYLGFQLNTPKALCFLGIKKGLRFRSIKNLSSPWGWKDPRNLLTLPIWLRLFPDAKVIHITRHGVDVAASLHQRHHQVFKQQFTHFQKHPLRHALYAQPAPLIDTIRCRQLEGAFTLWEEYLQIAQQHFATLEVPVWQVRYEELLDNPQQHLPSLLNFCGLNAQLDISKALSQLDSSRLYAYKKNEELNQFQQQVASRLQQYGY